MCASVQMKPSVDDSLHAGGASARVVKRKEKRNECRNDSFDRAGSGAVGCDSGLAPQQAMGLLPQRRYRIGVVDNRDIASAGQDIACRSDLASGCRSGSGSDQCPDTCSDPHGQGTPECDAHYSRCHICAANMGSQSSQEREKQKRSSRNDRNQVRL